MAHTILHGFITRPFLVGLFLIGLVAAALPAHADDAQIEDGAELYDEFCARCHGDDREGIPAFTDDVDSFNDRLAGVTEDMPDFTDFFEEDEIAAMFAYLSATNATEDEQQ